LEIIDINIGYYFGAFLAALWIMLPAYVPNPIAVLVGGGYPIDLGRNFFDGQRILGDGKTYRGFIIGVGSGILIGILQIFIQTTYGLNSLPNHTLRSVVLLALGALTGDLIKSFFKRRIGIEQGERWQIADQYDLVIGAFLFTAIFNYNWLITNVSLVIGIMILIITPILHRLTNALGYLLGMKRVPW